MGLLGCAVTLSQLEFADDVESMRFWEADSYSNGRKIVRYEMLTSISSVAMLGTHEQRIETILSY